MSARAKSITAVLMVSGATLLSAAPASADHHFTSIREAFPGSAAFGADSEFIELQMYADGQNIFGTPNDVTIAWYGAAGNPLGNVTFPSDVAVGLNQRSVLIATTEAETDLGVDADLELGNLDFINPAGGAICFRSNSVPNIDCVSWGTFDNNVGMLPVGTAETAIPDGLSITRSIAPGCPTLLEPGDDTNDSQTDFSATAPTPRNNSTAPTEAACVPPAMFTPPGNPTSPINPAGNVRKRKCKKSNRSATVAKKKKCKKKKKKKK